MKANKKTKLKNDKTGYLKVVGGLVALLLLIIIGVLVYWETQGSIDSFEAITTTYTEDSDGNTFTQWTGGTGSNSTGEIIKLDNSPDSFTYVRAWNGTGGGTAQACTAGTHYNSNGRYLQIVAGSLDNFTQVNVSYTSNMASSEDTASDMATTVFDLLPIIALAVVAAVIIGVVMGFGSGKRL